MSEIGGVFYFNGLTASSDSIQRLVSSMSRHGSDKTHVYEQPRYTSVLCEQNTFNSAQVDAPFSVGDRVVVTVDGRLDNRQYLIHSLKDRLWDIESGSTSARPPTQEISNARLIYASYLEWGAELLRFLRGDFFFSIVDSSRSQIILGRDPAGVRPGYYAHSAFNNIRWSSDLMHLEDILPRSGTLDPHFIAGYLALIESWNRTPFPNVAAVRPGECVRITESSVDSVLTNLLPTQNIQFNNDGEYEEAFRNYFREAVTLRMPLGAPVSCEVSGGLDSSSIACVARAYEAESPDSSKIRLISYLYDESKTSDERKFIRTVERQTGLATEYIRDHHVMSVAETYGASPNPQQLFSHSLSRVSAVMKSSGSRVLLSGHGGDQVLYSMGPFLSIIPTYLSRCGPHATLALMRSYSRDTSVPYMQMLGRALALHLLPRIAQSYIKTDYMELPPWISKDLCRATNLRLNKIRRPQSAGIGDILAQQRYNFVVNAISIAASNYYRERGIEIAYPFLDSELIKFLLAIPIEQLIRPSEYRSLMRRSLRGILPEEIRRRVSKQGPDEPITRGIRQAWPLFAGLLKKTHLADLGFIDQNKFERELNQARFGVTSNRASLLRALSLELWLRAWLE